MNKYGSNFSLKVKNKNKLDYKPKLSLFQAAKKVMNM